MACDRPLEKLEAFPHQAVASKGMPSTVHSEKGSKSHGIKKGVSSKKPGMPPMPRPPVHHIAYPKAAGVHCQGLLTTEFVHEFTKKGCPVVKALALAV